MNGIGKIVAYPLPPEIDGITRFPSVRHSLPICRFVPGSHDSGGKTRHWR
ncbi:transposase [Gemmatimonas groenlandica]|uniref:Transposase n=1 Tax=Gemmatimonas groenlandica TaxID=2732249 RepID=A0A6M4IST4_9BACT|nr:transposase [Gemmatimonas groenlandica]